MKPFNNSIATNKLRQETSVTSGGEAYAASLHAKKKKRNPFAEDEMSGYKELKGFRAGHTKDTGGFQYKDLWDVNEEYETEEKLKVTLKGDVNYNKIGDVTDTSKDGKYYTLQFKNGKTAIYHQSDVAKPAGQKSFEDKPELKIDEEYEAEIVPDRIIKFAQKKGMIDAVNQVAEWVKKAGKRIVGGVAIGKDYGTLVLDLTHEGSEIRITNGEDIEVNDQLVYDYESFLNALGSDKLDEDSMENKSANEKELDRIQNEYEDLKPSQKGWAQMRIGELKKLVRVEKEKGEALPFLSPGTDYKVYLKKHGLNENYSRFKKETVTRSKEQQMHEAMKLVRKKLYEAERVMDYVKTMKEELGLQENTSRYIALPPSRSSGTK